MPTYRFRYKVNVRPSEDTNKAMAALDEMIKDPSWIVDILREAIRETLLRAYKERFVARERLMADMIKADRAEGMEAKPGQPDAGKLPKTEEARKQFEREYSLRYGLDPETKGRDRREISRADIGKRKDIGAYEAGGSATPGSDKDRVSSGGLPLGEGSFRAAMKDVLLRLTDVGNIDMHKGRGKRVVFGIGNIAHLDKIETPKSGVSSSFQEFGIMWRQLEFGTGVFAKRVSSPYGGFRATGAGTKDATIPGAWWLGKRVPQGIAIRSGLRLKGSRPGNFLRTYTGLPYEQDAQRFGSEFQILLTRALRRGRG